MKFSRYPASAGLCSGENGGDSWVIAKRKGGWMIVCIGETREVFFHLCVNTGHLKLWMLYRTSLLQGFIMCTLVSSDGTLTPYQLIKLQHVGG